MFLIILFIQYKLVFILILTEYFLFQPQFNEIGTFNEDLPNSWECARCLKEGKNLESKV